MGDIKKQKKKYSTPSHPWQKERILEEIELLKEYGLKNKKEIWRMKTRLTKFAQQAKKLVASNTPQSNVEKKQLMARLLELNLIKENASLEDVLTITIKDIMERRLQTMIAKKGLARSVKQARQFIIHRHIAVNNKLITQPSYLIKKSEENKITFIPSSALSSIEHPERTTVTKPKDAKEKVAEKTAEKPADKAVKKKTEAEEVPQAKQ